MELFCGKKRWTVPEYSTAEIQRICLETGVSKTAAKLLIKLGITERQEIFKFLSKGNYDRIYDPFLLNDMDKAVERIWRAVNGGEKICIYGDYDVDGITSTAVLYNYLSSKDANVVYYIPKRLTEGYGMNTCAVDRLSNDGVGLIVTVDNGITANAEIDHARSLGIDVVVTDHHECHGELPDCCAVVNPKRPDSTYPFRGLAGVGVAFKLVCALEFKLIEDKYKEVFKGEGVQSDDNIPYMDELEFDAFSRKYIDLAALGTVADVMPLCDENREIVSRGLRNLCEESSLGVTALIAEASGAKSRGYDKNVTTSRIGFLVAPRLNAAGRIGDVNKALEILISPSFAKCLQIADELCRMNRERQNIENEILDEAIEIIERDRMCDTDRVLVLSGEKWHHGVVGIVSSRITEKYGLPSILICNENGVGKGSARSIKGFNINEAIHECRDLLIRHGGHELAAGLTIEMQNIEEFRRRINEVAEARIEECFEDTAVEADALLEGKNITLELCEEILLFEPFGAENPTPVFCMKDVYVKDIISLGQNKHTKLMLEKDGHTFEGLLFGLCPDDFLAPADARIDILFNLDINEFRGVKSPQLIIRDVAPCNEDIVYAEGSVQLADKVLLGDAPKHVPPIEKFRTVYKYLRNHETHLSGEFNGVLLARKISEEVNERIHPFEFLIIARILASVGLCELQEVGQAVMKIRLIKQTGKVDLEGSELLKRAKGIKED